MKKGSLLVTGLFLAFAISMRAEAAVSFTASAPESINAGDKVDIVVSMSGNTGLSTTGLRLQYDPALLSYQSATWSQEINNIGSMLKLASDVAYEGGRAINISFVDSNGYSGNGELITLHFTALKSYNGSPVTLGFRDASSTSGEDVTATAQSVPSTGSGTGGNGSGSGGNGSGSGNNSAGSGGNGSAPSTSAGTGNNGSGTGNNGSGSGNNGSGTGGNGSESGPSTGSGTVDVTGVTDVSVPSTGSGTGGNGSGTGGNGTGNNSRGAVGGDNSGSATQTAQAQTVTGTIINNNSEGAGAGAYDTTYSTGEGLNTTLLCAFGMLLSVFMIIAGFYRIDSRR